MRTMADAKRKSMSKSMVDTDKIIKFLDWNFTTCEDDKPESIKLDRQHCIDGFINGVPINLRCMYNKTDRNMSIRLCRSNGIETEYGKIKRNLETNGLYPRYFVKFYITNNKFTDVAKVLTSELFQCIDINNKSRVYDDDGTWSDFVYVSFDSIKGLSSFQWAKLDEAVELIK